MGVVSGKYAFVQLDACNFLEFEDSSVTYGANIEPYNSRAGGTAQKTIDGVESGNGTLNGFLDPDDPITVQLTTGSLVAITIQESQGSVTLASGNGRIGQFTINANRDGTPVRVSIPFTTDGTWSFS